MKPRSHYEHQIDRLANQLQDRLLQKVAAMQGRLYSRLFELIAGFKTDADGRLVSTTYNLRRLNRPALIVQGFFQEEKKGFLDWLVSGLLRLLGVSKKYHRSFLTYDNEVDERVIKTVMERLGYDTLKGELIAGGWMDTLMTNTPISQSIASDITTALAGKVPLAQFKAQFKQRFVNPAGMGYVQRYFDQFARDLFFRIDRSAAMEYASELELPFAIYAGTVMDDTRLFCRQRVNKIYSREEILEMDKLTWQGKNPAGSVLTECGGFRCRHHWRWISKELAERLKKQRGQE